MDKTDRVECLVITRNTEIGQSEWRDYMSFDCPKQAKSEQKRLTKAFNTGRTFRAIKRTITEEVL